MNESIIEIKNISKKFSTDRMDTYGLKDVTFSIQNQDFIAVQGASGSGKTTLLNILGLLSSPTSGEYKLKDKDMLKLKKYEKAFIRNEFIGFIFQGFNLIEDLTVLKNIELPLIYRKGISKQKRQSLVEHALERVGLSHRLHHFPSQLSGGQQQRVAIARSIVGSPAIVLADEPTGNLDTKNSQAIMDLLKELNDSGSTICVVTHDTRYDKMVNRRFYIEDGQLSESRS
jgi:putative ABC transport system ATP-binding protein